MKRRSNEINVFNVAMLDVVTGALGAFLIITAIIIPHYLKTGQQKTLEHNQQHITTQLESTLTELNLKLTNDTSDDELQKYQQEVHKIQGALITLNGRDEQLNGGGNGSGTEEFLYIALSWDLHDVDMDLFITDTSGTHFNFETPLSPERPGKLLRDTRMGPGSELWFTPVVDGGEYIVRAVVFSAPLYIKRIPIEVDIRSHDGHRTFTQEIIWYEGRCHNIAIISANNQKHTAIDRQYNRLCETRIVPPKLARADQ